MNSFFNPFFRPMYYKPSYLPPPQNPNKPHKKNDTIQSEYNKKDFESPTSSQKKDDTQNSKSKTDKKNSNNYFLDKPLIEFHGIQLYNDDLLILALIYFLYKEHITDNLLLLALFSLLF